MKPAVSVLMPARDAGGTVGAALASLRRQRLADWEGVVVDDGSVDDTALVVQRHAAEDPRVRLVRTPARGLVPTLTTGLEACRAPLVARMDADDVMHRDRLAAQVAALSATPAYGAIGCHVRLWPRTDLTDGRRAYESWLNGLRHADDVRGDRFVECPIAHPTLMARRDVLAAFGYRDCGWPEDYDLILRMIEAGVEVGIVPRRLLLWRDRPDRLSRVDGRYARDRFTACKAAGLTRSFLRDSSSYVLWGYGDTGKALARALASHGRRPVCILEVHPRRIGQRIDGVPVVGLEALAGVRGTPIVASVAGAGPRAEIRAHLGARGFVEGRDFVVAA